MMANRPEPPETMELDLARRVAEATLEALKLCNADRNKLTQMQTTPDYWINEAYKKA